MAHSETGRARPAGTVTFLLTQVERAAWPWEDAPAELAAAVARHREVVDEAVTAHGGTRGEAPDGVPAEGDDGAAVAAFGSAVDAVAAALAIQRALLASGDGPGAPTGDPDDLGDLGDAGVRSPRVRIGLHTGEARWTRGRGYGGAAVQRGTRLRDAAHGGQTVLSAVTASLVAEALPEGTWLVDRGAHRLRDLAAPERVFELGHDAVAGGFPPLRSLDALPNNLPAQLTSFVGRHAELAELERLLALRRLVTLTGAGGSGKTRLALQAAAALADRWPDGVWWVDLGSLGDASLVARTAATTMGLLVEPAGGPLRALQGQLRDRRVLLCLDTCEHVVEASAELADTLLRSCPHVSVLATSREPLRVQGEAVWRVPSLDDDDAVQLFADRAALVDAGFRLDPEDGAVHAVCRRLDGIPLALELAAAWVRALTPAQIAAGLDDRFRLLVGGPRGVIDRHQTLAASMEWSHRLLDADDRVVFRRLAVFAGGFTLDAARAVAGDDAGDGVDDGAAVGDVIGPLSRLVDKSLVTVDDTGTGDARYRLLDTVREYAAERLGAVGETAVTRDRHLAHFLALAEHAEPRLEVDQDEWRIRLEADRGNLHTALDWALGPEAGARREQGRRMADALARLWFVHGHTQEGTRFLDRAIGVAPDDRSVLQARLMAGAALVALGRGKPAATGELAGRGLAIAEANGDVRSQARCLAVGAVGSFYFDFAEARARAVRAQELGAAAGDVLATDYGRLVETCMLTNTDRHAEAARIAHELYERTLPRGERFCAAIALACMVWAELFTGDLRAADAHAVDSVRIAEPLGDYLTVGHAISNLAWVKCVAGEIDAGRKLMEPVTRSVEAAGPEVELASLGLVQAKLHLADGDLDGAVEWFGQATRYAAPRTDNWVTVRALPGLASTLRRLGRPDEAGRHLDRAVELAVRMGVPHAHAEALEQQAHLAAEAGSGTGTGTDAGADPERAADLHHQALAVRLEHGLRTFAVDSLEALAALAVRAGSHVEAVRLLGASAAARELMGCARPPVDDPAHEAVVAAATDALGADAFDEAWAAGAALTLDDAVAWARRSRGTRNRPSSGWASLTPTETGVVRLVAEGLTNPEIGERLFVSRATVKTHLSHVYAKLGVANRTELAALAAARLRQD